MALLMEPSRSSSGHQVVIEVGGVPIGLETTDAGFVHLLHGRYGDYVKPGAESEFSFSMELAPPDLSNPDADAEV